MFQDLIKVIVAAGGQPYLVGGWVRDQQLGLPSKDFDIEVFGVTSEQLCEILKPFGDVNLVGQSFGVVKVRTPEGNEFDFSSPRRDSKSGHGYTGFTVENDPFMHPKEAASRRDFTINTLMMEPVTNDILDFYDGLKHIKERRLVATSDKFAEDPLRVLRGMQFAARFGMAMDNDTIKMCQHLSCEFEYLTIERIFGEWYKMVTKGSYIRMGMDVLIQTGWIKHFPTWNRFYAENQPLFESNIIAAERLIIYCEEQNIVDYDRAVLVFATLLNEWDMAGEDYALSEIGCFPEITARVHKLLDVDFPSFTIAGVRQQAFKMVPATIREFLIIQASRGMASSYATALETMAQQGGCLNGSLPPVLSGKHLIEIGRKPGPEFGKILKEAYQAQMHGAFTDSSGAINWVKEKGC